MSLGQNIKQLREAKGWSTHRLAQEASTHQSSVWRFESDEVRPRRKTLEALATALGCDPVVLEYGKPADLKPPAKKKRIPLVDITQLNPEIALFLKGLEHGTADEGVWADIHFSSMAYAITVRGDSMLPEFRNGDIIMLEAEMAPRPGDFVVACGLGKDDESVFRQFAKLRTNAVGDDIIELRPLNPVYATWNSEEKPFKIIGTLVEISRKYRSH